MNQQGQSFLHKVRNKFVGFVSTRFQSWFPENTESKVRPRDDLSDFDDVQQPPTKRQRRDSNVEIHTNITKANSVSQNLNNGSTSDSYNVNINSEYESNNQELMQNETIFNTSNSSQPKSNINPKAEKNTTNKKISQYNNTAININKNYSQGLTTTKTSNFKSPFYPGSTMYGGVASYLRARKRFSPGDVETEEVSSDLKNKNEEKTVNGISLTAQRILKTLENFDSPLTDAKKIPVRPIKRRNRNDYRTTVLDIFKSRKKEESITSKKDEHVTEAIEVRNCSRSKIPKMCNQELSQKSKNDSYKFSSPIKINNDSFKSENHINNFKFSLPLKVITEKIIEQKLIEPKIIKSQSKFKSQRTVLLPKNTPVENNYRENLNVFEGNYFKSYSSVDFWSCVICSSQNDKNFKVCVTCNSSKDGLKKKALTVKNKNKNISPIKPKVVEIFWTCDICMIKNKEKASTCFACEGMNPNLNRYADYNINFNKQESNQSEQDNDNINKIITDNSTPILPNIVTEKTALFNTNSNLKDTSTIFTPNTNTLPNSFTLSSVENPFTNILPISSTLISSIPNTVAYEGQSSKKTNSEQLNSVSQIENLTASNSSVVANALTSISSNLSQPTRLVNSSTVTSTYKESPIIFGQSINSLTSTNQISNGGFSFSSNTSTVTTKSSLFGTNKPIATTPYSFAATANTIKQTPNFENTATLKTSTKRQLEETQTEISDKRRHSPLNLSNSASPISPYNFGNVAKSPTFNFSGSTLSSAPVAFGSSAFASNGIDAVNRIAATINGQAPALTSDVNQIRGETVSGRRIRRAVRRTHK